jgi:hypothetical protein
VTASAVWNCTTIVQNHVGVVTYSLEVYFVLLALSSIVALTVQEASFNIIVTLLKSQVSVHILIAQLSIGLLRTIVSSLGFVAVASVMVVDTLSNKSVIAQENPQVELKVVFISLE